MKSFVFSLDGKVFEPLELPTRKQAINAAIEYGELEAGDKVLVAEKVDVELPDINVEGLLNALGSEMTETVGEAAADWPDLTKANQKVLEKSISALVKGFLADEGQWPPEFFVTTDAEEVDIK
jgi:hypothetical protein